MRVSYNGITFAFQAYDGGSIPSTRSTKQTMSYLGQVIYVNDGMFQVYRTIKEEPNLNVDFIKQYWECSHTFKKDGLLFFCREIVSIPFEEIIDEDGNPMPIS